MYVVQSITPQAPVTGQLTVNNGCLSPDNRRYSAQLLKLVFQMKTPKNTPRAARKDEPTHAQAYRDKIGIALKKKPTATSAILRKVTCAKHPPRNLPFSNTRVRRKTGDILQHIMRARQNDVADRKSFLATFAWHEGFCRLDHVYVDLAAMMSKVYKALNRCTFEGVIIFELVIIQKDTMRRPLLRDMLSLHAHAVGWVMDPKFKPYVTRRAMSLTRAFKTQLGARSVDFRPAPNAAWIVQDAVYAFKCPTLVKRRATIKPRLGSKRTRLQGRGVERLNSTYAIRLAEVLSKGTIYDWVSGVGPLGAQIYAEMKRQLERWAGSQGRCTKAVGADKLDDAWKLFWKGHPSGMQPAIVLTGSEKRRADRAERRAGR